MIISVDLKNDKQNFNELRFSAKQNYTLVITKIHKMGKITEALDKIKNYEQQTDALYDIFKSINDDDLPIIWKEIEAGSALIRQRINEKGKDFNYVSDLYYPPAYCLTKYGRANLPFQQMFYACIFPSDSKAPYPRIITLQETSNFFKDEEACGIERATISKWKTTSNLLLLVIPFNGHYARACNDIISIQSRWDKIITSNITSTDAKELIDYMSKEISKEMTTNDEYFKIANFVNYLLYVNEKTKKADGILYPSVPAQGEGFNVVLKKEIADTKIKIEAAALTYTAKNKKNSYQTIINTSSKIINGNITYTPRTIDKVEKEMFDNIAKDLNYIN